MAARFKYEQILENLTESIHSGEYSPGSKLPSAQNLAEKFNTTQITANKALNILSTQGYIKRSTGSGSIVISKIGNKEIKAPVIHDSHLIGVIVFDISHPFWAGVISGIEEVCQKNGFNLLVGNDDGNLKKAELYIHNFIAQGVKGLIFVPIGRLDKSSYERENRRLIQIIEQANIPIVLLHRKMDEYQTSYAQLENYHSSYVATQLLLKQKSKNPLCISQYYSHVVSERNRGFINALQDAGYQDAEERIMNLHPIGQTVSKRELREVIAILEHTPKYDGILTITADMLDLVLLAGKHLINLSDVKIISFDYNNLLFGHKGILAMMDTPSVDMGHKSCEILFNKIHRTCLYDMQITLVPLMHIKSHLKSDWDDISAASEKKVIVHN